MAYTTIDDPSAFFQCTLYTGDGSTTHAITNGGNSDLQPDMVWIKDRGAANWHSITDVVRGHSKAIFPNDTAAEDTSNAYVKAFNSDGFTLGSAGSDVNANSNTYVSWQWKEQAGVFDIVSYTGNGSARTISHNLGAVPTMMIIKKRNTAAPWSVGHASLGANQVLELDVTDAVATDNSYWNNTRPTSSVFSVGTDGNQNTDGHTYVIYLFGNKQGVSKMGSYTGNGNANGEFIYTGFKPRWIMIKGTNIARNWGINDTKRSPINQTQDSLYSNVADAETGSGNYIDFLSNGFKLRDTALTMNGAYNYIYMAFAENPFVTSTGVPATAR